MTNRGGRLWWGRTPQGAGPTERVSDMMSDWEEEQFLIATRRIHLFGEIDDEKAQQVVQRLQRLAAESPDPIHLYISSDGGLVDAGYTIIDQMLLSTAPVTTVVAGRAYSMGAVIAAFGAKGRRFIMPCASVMLHPLSFDLAGDYIEPQLSLVAFLKAQEDHITRLLAERLRLSVRRLKAMTANGLWLLPQRAIALRLADGLWTAELEAEVNRRAGTAGRQGKGKLAQISKILRVLSDGIENNEELAVEREG